MRRSILSAAAAFATLCAQAAPKLILHGWDTLDVTPAELLANADQIGQTGADGVSFAIRTQNAAQERIHSGYLMEGADWQWQDVARYADTLRQMVQRPGLGASMLHFRCQPSVRLALTNDAAWARAAANLAVLARLAKEGGLAGLTLDAEDRQASRQYVWDPDCDPPWDEAVALMRRRGAAFFGGAFAAFPEMDLLAFALLSRDPSYGDDPADPELATQSRRDLWPAFVNGLLDVLPPTARISDGDAGAFGYASVRADFAQAASRQLTGLLPLVAPENRAKYRAQNLVGFGLCLDSYVRPADDPSGHPAVRGSRVAAFDDNLKAALKASDGYVWLYGEHHPFVEWAQPPTSPTMFRWCDSTTWEGPLPGLRDVLERRTKPLAFAARRLAEKRADGTYENRLPGSVTNAHGNVIQFLTEYTTDMWYALTYDMAGVGRGLVSWMGARGWQWEYTDYATYTAPDADGVRHGAIVVHAPPDCAQIHVCLDGNPVNGQREVAYSNIELVRLGRIATGSVSENLGRIAEANLSTPIDLVPSGGVGLVRGDVRDRASGPANLTGVTYAGGNRFYVVADSSGSRGLYEMTAEFSSDGKTVSSPSFGPRVELTSVSDPEGVAYDPGSGCVWVADEGTQAIVEFDPTTGAARRHVDLPGILRRNAADRGLKALTLSGDGLVLWAANGEALTCDGAPSSYYAPTVVRLVKFSRPRIDADWTLSAMYAYMTDVWHQPYDIGGTGRRGISDLCALPDGSLLVLERERSAYDVANYYAAVYRLTAHGLGLATDVKALDSLADVSRWTPVAKELLYEQLPAPDARMLNLEGLCLGPRLETGHSAVLALTDAGDGVSDACLVPFALSGLDIRTLSFERPAYGTSTLVGSPFRFLEGASVTVGIAVTADTRPYALDGTPEERCDGWQVSSGTPLPGSGPTATFVVSGDATFAWDVSAGVADRGYHVADSFEGFDAGTPVEALDGWSGVEGEIEEVSYVPPTPPGYAMPRETHTRVLRAEDIALERTIPAAATTEKIDVMAWVWHAPGELEEPPDDTLSAVAADSRGRICLWHLFEDEGTWRKGWIPLSETAYADGSWVRIGLEFDYTGNPDGDAFVRVSVNGSYRPTEHGVRAPDDVRSFGSWHYLAKNRRSGGVLPLSRFCFLSSKVDDLVVGKKKLVTEHTGPISAEGIPFDWFDRAGLPREPHTAAPFIPGYTLGDAHDAGVDPYADRPLEVTDFALDADGNIHLELNGYRGDNPVTYRLMRSETPDFLSPTVVGPDAGTFAGDASSRTTTWDGRAPGAGFYKISASR